LVPRISLIQVNGYSHLQGDWVYIENMRGRIKQKAVLTDSLDPRVVIVEFGWWYPEKEASELYGWAE